MEKLFYFIRNHTTRNFYQLAVFIWIFFIYLIFFISADFNFSKIISGLQNWDSGHYLSIAQRGYGENYQYAFFPIYPILIKMISFLTGSYLSSAIIISLFSTIMGLFIFSRILEKEFKKSAKKIFISLLFFPTSFFLLIPYTESLFFLLTMLFFYFLKRNFLIASLFCGFALTSRASGVALLAVLTLELLQRETKKKFLYYLMAFIPAGVYLSYLFLETGSPFTFLSAQMHWERAFSMPTAGFWNSLIRIFTPSLDKIDLKDVFNLGFSIFGLGLILRGFRFLKFQYSLYSIISIAIPLFTGSLVSIPRFLVTIFPIFILIGKAAKLYWIVYLVCSIFLLIYFCFLFINGQWVS